MTGKGKGRGWRVGSTRQCVWRGRVEGNIVIWRVRNRKSIGLTNALWREIFLRVKYRVKNSYSLGDALRAPRGKKSFISSTPPSQDKCNPRTEYANLKGSW